MKITKPLKAVIKNGKPASIDVYGSGDVVPIENGGTGADNISDILKNIGAAPLQHSHGGSSGGSSSQRIYGENPRGAYDSKNTDYRTTYAFVSNTIKLYLNGLGQSVGSDNDFTFIEPNIIRMNDPPYEGDLLTIDYDMQAL